jgi:AAA+ ATPase superfamily predicted ATPase
MSIFIGRKEELSTLGRLLNKKSASLIVIKGRRRIGKSRLLEEFGKSFERCFSFSGLPPSPNTSSMSQKNEFVLQLARQTGEDDFKKDDWSELFWRLSEYSKQKRCLIILDEISWMGLNLEKAVNLDCKGYNH